MHFYVYLLISYEGHHYTGQTTDVSRRLAEHNAGMCHSTKHGYDWTLLLIEEFETRSSAVRRERWLKSLDGRIWIKENIPGWMSAHRGVESESE